MPSNVNRMDRLNAEFQKDIYEIIVKKIKNPFITEMVSVLKVDTSRDLKSAKVFVSIYSTNADKKQKTFDAIKEESKRIRYFLARSSTTRTIPELHFILDDSIEYGDKMDKLFLEIEKSGKEGR